MCMVDGKSCLPYEASRSCEELSGTAAFSFYSAWNRRTPNNSPCEIILEGDQERYQCDEDFYAQISVSARLRITSESSSRGSFENDVTTTKAFMYLTGTSEFVQRQIEVSRGLYKDLKMSFMMSQLAGPGFVPAVAIWFSNGDDVTELKLLSATSGDPQSGITPIQNGIDLVDNTKYCFVSAGTEQNNWALIDIPFAFVSHVELLNRYIQNERMEGTVVEVCDRPGHCTLCGVAGSTKASAWATVECVGGPLRGNQIRLDQSSSVLQFCEIKVFGKVALNCFHRADVAPNAMFEVPSDRSEDTTGLNFCIDKTYCPEFKKFTMCVTPDPLSTRNIAPLGCTSNLVDQCPTGSLPAFDFYSGYSAFAGYIPPCVESAIGYLKVLDCYVTANASYGLLVEQFDGASGTSLAIDYLPTGYPVFTNLWVAKDAYLGFVEFVILHLNNKQTGCLLSPGDVTKTFLNQFEDGLPPYVQKGVYLCLEQRFCPQMMTEVKICMKAIGENCFLTTEKSCGYGNVFEYFSFYSYEANWRMLPPPIEPTTEYVNPEDGQKPVEYDFRDSA